MSDVVVGTGRWKSVIMEEKSVERIREAPNIEATDGNEIPNSRVVGKLEILG